jgi:hypothetical protein
MRAGFATAVASPGKVIGMVTPRVTFARHVKPLLMAPYTDPFRHTSKWRWYAVVAPVFPTTPIC